jgi:hypothetical protein
MVVLVYRGDTSCHILGVFSDKEMGQDYIDNGVIKEEGSYSSYTLEEYGYDTEDIEIVPVGEIDTGIMFDKDMSHIVWS